MKPLSLILLAAVVLYTAFKVREWIAIDRCLDRGGRWDYEKGQCVEDEKVEPTRD